MSTPPGKAISQPKRMRRQAGRRRSRLQHRLLNTGQPAASREGDMFWRQLEEREEGRLALEADHLFDTSSMWAA